MGQPYVGEIRIFAGNFAPVGWAFCDGTLMSIEENETLFQVIGTTYGGDGQSTFALPDLRSRFPVHQGPNYGMGQSGGVEAVTVRINEERYSQLREACHGLGWTAQRAISEALEQWLAARSARQN